MSATTNMWVNRCAAVGACIGRFLNVVIGVPWRFISQDIFTTAVLGGMLCVFTVAGLFLYYMATDYRQLELSKVEKILRGSDQCVIAGVRNLIVKSAVVSRYSVRDLTRDCDNLRETEAQKKLLEKLK